MTRCGALAVALQKGAVKFRHLDAAQLLKHALGLHANHLGRFTLCYPYADPETPEGKQHRNEITEFGVAVDGDIPFVSLSYATFLKGLHRVVSADHDSYFAYMGTRYRFAGI